MSSSHRNPAAPRRPMAVRLLLLGLLALPILLVSRATGAAPGADWSRVMVIAPAADLAAPSPVQTEVAAGPWRLTVREVVTGDEANALVTGASPANQAPLDGSSYLAVKLLVTNAGTLPARIANGDFVVIDSQGIGRRFASVVAPDPALDGTVEPGASLEGWIVGGAPAGDEQLVLLFDSVTLTGDWADAAFALTEGAARAPVEARPVELNRAGRDIDDPAGFATVVATRDWAVELLEVVHGADVAALFPESDYRTTALVSNDPSSAATWLAFRVRVTNNRTDAQPAFLPPTAFTLADSQGSPNPDLSWLTSPHPDVFGSYAPGASREGWVVFDTASSVYVPEIALLRFLPYRTDGDVRYFTWDGGAASVPSEPSFEGTLETGRVVVTTEDLVRMRESPSTEADIVTEMAIGTELIVTGPPEEGDGLTWYPVEDRESGDAGYVAQQFIEPIE